MLSLNFCLGKFASIYSSVPLWDHFHRVGYQFQIKREMDALKRKHETVNCNKNRADFSLSVLITIDTACYETGAYQRTRDWKYNMKTNVQTKACRIKANHPYAIVSISHIFESNICVFNWLIWHVVMLCAVRRFLRFSFDKFAFIYYYIYYSIPFYIWWASSNENVRTTLAMMKNYIIEKWLMVDIVPWTLKGQPKFIFSPMLCSQVIMRCEHTLMLTLVS